MKILMIAPTPYFADRGAHVQIYEQANSLQNLNHEVRIVTYGIGRDTSNIHTVRCWTPKYYRKLEAGPSLTKIFLIFPLIYTTIREIRKFDPDVIHAHLHEGALIGKIVSLYRKVPTIFDYQGSLTLETKQYLPSVTYKLFGWILRILETRINSWFVIVTQSESMKNKLLENPYKVKSVHNIHDGVDVNRFKPAVIDADLANSLGVRIESTRFIYMGYFAEHQGFEILLKAMKIVLAEIPDSQLILLGYPMTQYYLKVIDELGLSKNIVYVGKVDYFKAHHYLSLGSIAVAPKISLTEGDGKIYNYMSMGMKIVAFDRPTSREILEDAAIYAQETNSKSLADSMIRATTDFSDFDEKARKLAISKLSWTNVATTLLKIYSEEISK